MSDIRLSEHFLQSEFACKCGCGIATTDMRLVKALEELRTKCGNKPFHILSGYRCKEHNAAVGGAKSSQHGFGLAADVKIDGMSLKEIVDKVALVKAFDYGGFGIYPPDSVNGPQSFIHLDVGRKGPARWARVEGKYISLMEGLTHDTGK